MLPAAGYEYEYEPKVLDLASTCARAYCGVLQRIGETPVDLFVYRSILAFIIIINNFVIKTASRVCINSPKEKEKEEEEGGHTQLFHALRPQVPWAAIRASSSCSATATAATTRLQGRRQSFIGN